MTSSRGVPIKQSRCLLTDRDRRTDWAYEGWVGLRIAQNIMLFPLGHRTSKQPPAQITHSIDNMKHLRTQHAREVPQINLHPTLADARSG